MNKCSECTYWYTKTKVHSNGKYYRTCCCGMAQGAVIGSLQTTCDFGCPYWAKREPTLKERLTEHVEWARKNPRYAPPASKQAEMIMEMFEEYKQKS